MCGIMACSSDVMGPDSLASTEIVPVSRTEWMLLQHLAQNAGKVVLHSELLTKVWGPAYRDDLQYLRVWVSRLRAKLEVDPSKPSIIRTLQGVGYRLDLGDVPDAPYFAVVRTSKKMDVKIAAELAEMPIDEFLSLNPQHNRPVMAGADELRTVI